MVVGAVALDLLVGDPPNRWHPVAWLGTAIGWGRRLGARGSRTRLLVAGALVTLAVAMLAGLGGLAVAALARSLGIAGLVVEAIALSTLLSIRGLFRAAARVDTALARGDLDGARRAVGEDLVSRPTAGLDEAQVVSATVESVAENLSDSVLAPVCFYLAFGLAGAAVYRAVNTADAMIGYREGVLEYFGKTAARLDDVLNLVPARLSGLAILGAAMAPGFSARAGWQVMRRDPRRCASPNAGIPMSVMAGALGVTLEKPGTYRLGDGRWPERGDIGRSVRLTAVATALGLGAAVALRVVFEVTRAVFSRG